MSNRSKVTTKKGLIKKTLIIGLKIQKNGIKMRLSLQAHGSKRRLDSVGTFPTFLV